MTPDEAAKLSSRNRSSVRVKEAELRAAAAKVDQALFSYFPKVSLIASYTRSSKVENTLDTGGAAIVAAQNSGQPLTTGPCPASIDAGKTCVLDAGGVPVGASSSGFELPVLVNSYSVMASVSLPISDWVLRMTKGLSAAAHGEKAKKIEVEAEQLQVAADAKITFFNWVRAKGQVVVAQQAVAQTKAHLDEARRMLEVGLTSRADVLRLEAQVASADLLEAEADSFSIVVEQQLRQAISLARNKPLEIGIDVMNEPAGAPLEALDVLQKRGMERRLEIRALEQTQAALKDAEDVTSAGFLPRLEIIANGMYANPNPRIFPQKPQWDLTWEAGLRLTWNVNDTFATAPAVAEAKATTMVVAERKVTLRDALVLEVTQAYADMKKAVSSIEATSRGLAAAEASLQVRAELWRSGKATSVDLIDAETEVTRSRLRRLDARVGLLVARTRLDHATGRDVPVK